MSFFKEIDDKMGPWREGRNLTLEPVKLSLFAMSGLVEVCKRYALRPEDAINLIFESIDETEMFDNSWKSSEDFFKSWGHEGIADE
jgi:hypothetical protein